MPRGFTDEEIGMTVAPVSPKKGFTDEEIGMTVAPQGPTTAEERGVTSTFQFGSEGVNRFVDAVLGVPNAALELLPSPASIVERMLPNPVAFSAGEQPQLDPGRSLADDLGQLPIPSAEQIRAGVSAAVPDASGLDLGQRFQRARLEQEQRKQEFPTSTAAGEVAGDIGTIVTGRGPLAARQRAAQVALPDNTALVKFVPPGAKRAIDDVFRSKAVKGLGSAAGKATEAGLEAYTLSVLQGGDPAELAAYAAGGQLGGSALLKLGTTKSGLMATALAATAWLQVGKTITPGGDNFILPSVESGFEKVTLAIVGGLLAGAAGAGRLRGRQFENFPKIMDAITATPRAGIISFINDERANPDPRTETVLKTLIEEPNAFTVKHRERLNKALRNPKVSWSKTLDDLMRIRSFRTKIESLNPPEAPITGS